MRKRSSRGFGKHSPTRLARYVAALAAAILTLGILAAPAMATSAKSAKSAPAKSAPAKSGPGCDATRPAVAHRAGGAPVSPPPRPRALDTATAAHLSTTTAPIPCAVIVGPTTETANIGVSPNGTVFYGPWVSFSSLPVDPATPSMVARSRDNGATWDVLDPTSTPAHNTLVPWLDVDPQTSRVWYATLGQDAATCGSETFAHISWSDDNGRTWQNPREQSCRQLQGGMSVVEGPAPAGGARPVGYPHVVYQCGNVTDGASPLSVHCWKSLDGGQTWSYVAGPNNAPGCADERPRGRAVGPDGTFYMSIQCDDELEIAVSHNEGATWQIRPVAAGSVDRLDVSSITTDSSGNVYIVWVAGGTGGPAGVPALGNPYLAVSHDGGATWGKPLMVAAPGVQDVTEDAITAGAKGHVAISYLGTTDGNDFNGYITESWHADDANPVFWSAPVNNPEQPLMVGSAATSAVHGDRMWFVTVALGPGGNPWAAFHCAYTTACPLRDGVVGRLVSQPDTHR